MQDTRKTQCRDAAARSAAASDAQRQRLAGGESLQSVLDALADRIGRDASDDAVTYLLRSDTAHDGE